MASVGQRFKAGSQVEVYDAIAGTWTKATIKANRTGNIKVKYDEGLRQARNSWITGIDNRRIRLIGEGLITSEEKQMATNLSTVMATPNIHVIGDEIIVKRKGQAAVKFIFQGGSWFQQHRDGEKSRVAGGKGITLKVDVDKAAAKMAPLAPTRREPARRKPRSPAARGRSPNASPSGSPQARGGRRFQFDETDEKTPQLSATTGRKSPRPGRSPGRSPRNNARSRSRGRDEPPPAAVEPTNKIPLFSVGNSSPARRKLNDMNHAAFYRKIARVESSSTRTLNALVQAIKKAVGSRASPLELCFGAYYWICTNVACNLEMELTPEMNVAVVAMQEGQCPFEGYARLFEILVTKMDIGVQNHIIHGTTKERFANARSRMTHSWNALQLNGRWELVDCCWGAGRVNRNKKTRTSTFIQEYEEFYFCTPPYCLIYTHFPDDPQYQFLSQPIDQLQFDQLMKIQPKFWKLGINVCTHFTRQFQTTGYERLVFHGNRDVEMTAKISKPDSATASQYKTFPVDLNDRGKFVLDARFPYNGRWVLDIFVRDRNSSDWREFTKFVRYEVENVKILN